MTNWETTAETTADLIFAADKKKCSGRPLSRPMGENRGSPLHFFNRFSQSKTMELSRKSFKWLSPKGFDCLS